MQAILILLGKAVVIAGCAALMSTACIVALFQSVSDGSMYEGWAVESIYLIFSVALLGSFGVGLPVALLTYWLAGAHLKRYPSLFIVIAALSGTMLVLASIVLAGSFGAIFFGVPSLAAAGTFGLLGWFWIIRPERIRHHE